LTQQVLNLGVDRAHAIRLFEGLGFIVLRHGHHVI